jgi:hypothetical protein
MDRADADAIARLFDRLEDVERRAAPRDPDAEALIARRAAANPAAAYRMAQTILAQEIALEQAQCRLAELEARLAESGGGFLAGIFGEAPRPRGPAKPALPFGPGAAGGGFLAGAAQTALGVAGGVLLANALAGTLDGFGAAELDEGDAFGDFDL